MSEFDPLAIELRKLNEECFTWDTKDDDILLAADIMVWTDDTGLWSAECSALNHYGMTPLDVTLMRWPSMEMAKKAAVDVMLDYRNAIQKGLVNGS